MTGEKLPFGQCIGQFDYPRRRGGDEAKWLVIIASYKFYFIIEHENLV